MKFQYSFQKIVDLKNNEKTQAEWLLSEAIHRLQHEESSLEDLLSLKQNIQDRMTEASQSATISELQLYQEYVIFINEKIELKHVDVRKAQNHVVDKQEHLTVKMLDEKIWSKAREKEYTNFRAISLKKEQDQIDEMASIRYSNQ